MESTRYTIKDAGVEEAAVSDTMMIVLIVIAAVVACFLFLALAYYRQQQYLKKNGQVADATHDDEASPHGTYQHRQTSFLFSICCHIRMGFPTTMKGFIPLTFLDFLVYLCPSIAWSQQKCLMK
jgi:predicted histidine transporter YuiF (NhaC family)